jgi:hypothetical protein
MAMLLGRFWTCCADEARSLNWVICDGAGQQQVRNVRYAAGSGSRFRTLAGPPTAGLVALPET